jgi:nucleoside-diphosphate-sugar epimerase
MIADGHAVRAVDVKPIGEWFQVFESAENLELDLSLRSNARYAVQDVDWVMNLAADMGGMGFIEKNKALCMLSVLINTHLLLESHLANVERYFFASSACVYSSWHQNSFDPQVSLKEADAYPADPEDGYGWEKLFSERMCRHFFEDFGLDVRIARFHNVYGPMGSFDGGREKAPAAACRKLIEYSLGLSEAVTIWGDGNQLRSFTYIDDCVEGVVRLMNSSFTDPLNIGSSETVSIRHLYETVASLSGVPSPAFRYELDAPQGVRGRSSNNDLCRSILDWEPQTTLSHGLQETFNWVKHQILKQSSVGG